MQRLDYASAVDDAPDWALLRPGKRHELWTVVLHGHGSHGDQLYTRRDVREKWLPDFLDTGAGIITLNLRDNAWMCPAAAADMHAVLDFLRAEFGMQKTIFCSGSMGGTGNLIYGVLYPGDVAGIVARGVASDVGSYYRWCTTQTLPILREIADAILTAYGADPDHAPEIYRRHSAQANVNRLAMPVYLTHGGADRIIPVEQSRILAELLRDKKNFFYHEIPGGDHDSPLHDKQGLSWVLQRI
ncbi:MAG: hypothetical protein PHW60_08560 [Kiritimatiellae bacterium]|nr:hypothetical protein [Kiritimatiellia bacterium]